MKLPKILVLTILSVLLLNVKAQSTLDTLDPHRGLWLGLMEVSEQMSLQLAYEIERDAGSYSAKLNVVEQKAFDIPMDTCIIEDDSIIIAFKAAGIASKNYTQGGGSLNNCRFRSE